MSEEFTDKEMDCAQVACGKFMWEKGEQKFYASKTDRITGKPFTPPRYCPKHRAERKAAREKREKSQESPFNPNNWKREGDGKILGL